MSYPIIILKPKRNESLKRKHPWVFSGAIDKILLDEDAEELREGDLVQVADQNEKTLGVGHFGEGSIAVRMLSFKKDTIDASFWERKLKAAFQLRSTLHLTHSKSTTCYRLVHAEGDDLPGLVVDIYGSVAIVQAHSKGFANALPEIAKALKAVMGDKLTAVYSKSEKAIHRQGEESIEDGYLLGEAESPQIVLEHNLLFEIDWVNGQKTGFFIDQRFNRELLKTYSKGKKVLNTFCYSGGFSVYALAAGATELHSVDSSQKAIELTDRNVAINFKDCAIHKSFAKDTLKYLNETDELYDTIILDPPAYAKSKSAQHKAVQGYKRLNAKAFSMIKKGGILFTFSCSQVVDRKLFENTIMAAAIEARRSVKVLHHLSQPADHPVSIFHPEGEYLKGLVLYIEE
ncbi:class I SAM-dependent rRNA methyltransferase [Vicingaceae bacterium]|nr:class I SAM-dependent rRNA methyltransferase [Vicingaceae bacterium]